MHDAAPTLSRNRQSFVQEVIPTGFDSMYEPVYIYIFILFYSLLHILLPLSTRATVPILINVLELNCFFRVA